MTPSLQGRLHHTGRGVAPLAWVFILALISLAPQAARAQVLYGSLTGNVTDQTGAAITGAKVEALNLGTGVAKNTTTDERGAYLLSDLQAGVYKVTITATSFKPQAQENVRIEGNTVRRIDVQLQVGEVSGAVEVTTAAEALQTDRADVNITQSARQINNLPLFGSVGRNYQSLIYLIPGTTRGTGGFFINQSGTEDNSAAGNPQRSMSFNVNGVSRLQNNTRIDGSSVIYPWLPTNTVYVPPAEAIQEVNIVTNAFDAEQGLAGGAAINVTIKTGGNSLHGVGWGYDTNSAFLSRRYFQPANQTVIPKNILAQFGYALSGPVYLPKIFNGRNKLFFFTDLERTTQRNAAGGTFTVAPASLRPDSSGNVNFTGTGITVYDPLSNPDPALRTPFPNNTIPANRIDIAATEILKRLPQPNLPGFTNNFAATGVGEFNRTNIDNKVNYDSGGKLTLFGRYSISPTLIIDPPIFGEVSGPALNGGQLGTAPGRIQVVGIGGTYTFNPRVVLDANVGYTRQRIGAEGFDIVSNFGLEVLKIPGTNGPDRLQGGVPAFQINGGWTNIGNDNTGNPFLFRDNQYVAAANLSWLKGAHSFRFGFDYLNPQLNHFQPQGGSFQTVRGTFGFSGNATRQQGNASSIAESQQFHSWADFLLGRPTAAGKVDQLRNPNSVWWKQYAFYARDHWQIGRKLTLTYGLRFEGFNVPRKDHTGINRFDPDTGNVVTGGLGGVPFDTGAEGAYLFLPRIGLAFRLNDKTVLRGGYGQSADPRPFQDVRNAYPIANIWSMPAIVFNGAQNSFIPVTTLRQGLINTSTPPDINAGILPLPANTGTTTFPKEARRDRIHSFNFFVERELPAKFTAQVGYAGTRAVNQMGFININAGPPGTGNGGRPLATRFGIVADINSIQPYGTTTYDGLQVLVRRRFGNSIFGSAYTWSKTINFADNDGGPRIQYLPEKQRNRGLASYDRTHNSQTYLVYDLPFGKGQRWANSGWASRLFGGFQVSGVMSITSGLPIYIIQGSAPNLLAGGSAQVPNQLNPDIRILGGIGTASQRGTAAGPWFDNTVQGLTIQGVSCTSNCAWAPENGARFGTVGRNTLRGPGFFETDASIFRTFSITERVQFQFRAEALNATNHANFANPTSDINSSTFGFITGTYGPNQSRQWRFGARISF
ncbi:MAG TPA: TonB-dependent receptor [Blastocatellia bacterium]|nr:TonB-dependent receptor [Blastocatellia bacterium]